MHYNTDTKNIYLTILLSTIQIRIINNFWGNKARRATSCKQILTNIKISA